MLENASLINAGIWLALALGLGILDLMLGANFLLLWLALCSIIVATITYLYPAISLITQLIIFFISASLALSGWIIFINKDLLKIKSTVLNRRTEQLIGRKALLIEPITNNYSKIQLDDTFWKVQISESLPQTTSTNVEVIGALGLILIVKILPN